MIDSAVLSHAAGAKYDTAPASGGKLGATADGASSGKHTGSRKGAGTPTPAEEAIMIDASPAPAHKSRKTPRD